MSRNKAELFWSRVVTGREGCWEWQGSTNADGYGQFYRRTLMAHRYSYEACVGPIPEGYQIDHLCKNRRCVRPSHLEAVTPLENTRRSDAPAQVVRRLGFCKRGHPRKPANLRYSMHRGVVRWTCIPCKRITEGERWARRKAAAWAALVDEAVGE
jgi:hypothetical protein